MKKNSSLWRLFAMVDGAKAAWVFILFFLLLSTAFTVLAPQLIARITNLLQAPFTQDTNVDMQSIFRYLIMLAILYLFASLFSYLARKQLLFLSQSCVFFLREQLQHKLHRVPLSYLDKHPRGDLLARATVDISNVTNLLESTLSSLIVSVTILLGTLLMMFLSDVRLALIFVISLPLSLFSIRFITLKTRKMFKKQQKTLGELNSHIEEMTRCHEVMIAFNYESVLADKLSEINARFYKAYLRSRTLSGVISPLVKFINNLVYIALCVFGGILILNGRLTLGGLQAFLMYANNISAPISQFSMQLNQVQEGLSALERIFAFLDAEEEEQDTNEIRLDLAHVQGKVCFDGVQFGYTPDKLLMDHLSFEANQGDVVAIVGPSGAGKTTLVNLLMRFYDLCGGQIYLDRTDISTMQRTSLQKGIGMILQDSWLFSGSIAENIAYGNPNASFAEIQDAAKRAQCDDFIRQLPNGYDSHLSSFSSNLSVGEKQLLCIARTLLCSPKILILDEATSNIDACTEQRITQTMQRMMQGRTTFIIAHRLHTIQNANTILFMKDGDVVEQGTHQKLLEMGGLYAEMYNS